VGLAGAGETANIPITHLVRRKVRLLGSFGARPRVDMPVVVQLAASGAIDVRSAVSRRYPFARAQDAYRDLSNGEIVGRAIIDFTA
jgi:S-(hydroxymethyl)glutathione dehydrogenase/alcohol dehydrogenase